jgi:hypothetical protein
VEPNLVVTEHSLKLSDEQYVTAFSTDIA